MEGYSQKPKEKESARPVKRRWATVSTERHPAGRVSRRAEGARHARRSLARVLPTPQVSAPCHGQLSLRDTNASASRAKGSHSSSDVGETAIHSFMSRPSCRGAKRSPAPPAMSASTRCRGSLTTSVSVTSMAKILPWTRRAAEPNPVFPVEPRVTSALPRRGSLDQSGKIVR